jgi:hypothetical protein
LMELTLNVAMEMKLIFFHATLGWYPVGYVKDGYQLSLA